MKFTIREILQSDIPWIAHLFKERWAGEFIVTRANIHRPQDVEGFLAESKTVPVGLVTFKMRESELEVISLDSLVERQGIGTALLNAVIDEAERRKLNRVWVITTNENRQAIQFYKKHGFCLVQVYPDAMEVSRKLKPSIPEIGPKGIPIRDEIELEYKLLQ